MDIKIRIGSSSEVSRLRSRNLIQKPKVLKELASQGYKALNRGVATINGKKMLDLVFMGMRMEHGLGGQRRTPHWAPAQSVIEEKSLIMIEGLMEK